MVMAGFTRFTDVFDVFLDAEPIDTFMAKSACHLNSLVSLELYLLDHNTRPPADIRTG